MLNEWHLLAYVRDQLATGVPLVILQMIPDLTGTRRRPAPDAPDAYGHARDADGRTYALGPDWPKAWRDFWTTGRVNHSMSRPADDPTYGIATFRIGPGSSIGAPF